MQVITRDFVQGKKVLLRLDIDVPLRLRSGSSTSFEVAEDFRLRAGLPTLKLCLEHAAEVIVMGHIGRPEGKVVPELSVEPIRQWFPKDKKLIILENLRFDSREEACDLGFAKELAGMGSVFVNEAFASYRPSVSTTILPTLLPAFAGLRFAQEVKVLTGVRDNPKKPFIAIMGGAKVEDKLPVINVLAQKADAVLVGGKLAKADDLNDGGTDISQETVEKWRPIIKNAKMIVWNGPLGKFEDLPAGRQGPKNDQTRNIARMILDSGAEVVIGGGDSITALNQYGLLQKAEKVAFVSTGGGAMLKFLAEGTLPAIEALKIDLF